MELAAVILARVLGYVETIDLTPQGRVFFPHLAKALVERYEFQKFPKSFEEFDENKGIEFDLGHLADISILKFTIFGAALVVDTRSSTADSVRVLNDMLKWGVEKFGLNYKPGMIKRFGYVSDLTFYSDAPLLEVHPAIRNLATETSRLVSGIWKEEVQYEGQALAVGHDPLSRKLGIAPFSIARRAEARFSEHKYFSEAPLPTEIHQKVLEQYEKDVIAAANAVGR